ncbi:MAG: cobyric acid synthase CobQ, partial [Deltaproteobacteria bacterium]|nr:cobyric acid synthase CobQ [Deltaproteobacteria bacterium]
VLGVIPYLTDLHLPEEDGVTLDRIDVGRQGRLNIVVLYLPHISNFTDFDPLEHEPGVSLRYVRPGQRIGDADVVILPGSKNTIDDLLFLKREGYAEEILDLWASGKKVIGICGGFQMLGKKICDPLGVESSAGETAGLGLLDVATVLQREKMTFQVKALSLFGPAAILEGYEIHMGETSRGSCARPAFRITERLGTQMAQEEGAISGDGRVWGTYLHGLFENNGFRRGFIESFVAVPGRRPSLAAEGFDYKEFKKREFDRLAVALRKALDFEGIYRIAGIQWPG